MTDEWTSTDGRCRVTATPLREYRMGVFPELLTVQPPIAGIENFYFMGGQVLFDETAKSLLLWDDSDVVVFQYATNRSYSYHGPLFVRISNARLTEGGKKLSVEGWQRDKPFLEDVTLGSTECPAGLGHVNDGIFTSTPASEHPNRRRPQPKPSFMQRLRDWATGRTA